jgi:AbrB family looped-hinge helix DNA binding protein
MPVDRRRMRQLTQGLGSKSEKMRVLSRAGYERADIARFLGTRYQFVRNVLVREEERSAERASSVGEAAGAGSEPLRLRVGPDGRVVIPAAFREALRLAEGDTLIASVSDGELHLLTRQAAVRRAQAIVRQFVPAGVSLVDELLEDRQREVEHEQQNG